MTEEITEFKDAVINSLFIPKNEMTKLMYI